MVWLKYTVRSGQVASYDMLYLKRELLCSAGLWHLCRAVVLVETRGHPQDTKVTSSDGSTYRFSKEF